MIDVEVEPPCKYWKKMNTPDIKEELKFKSRKNKRLKFQVTTAYNTV